MFFLTQNYKGTFGDFSKITQSELFTITFSLVFKEMKEKVSELGIEQPSTMRKEKAIEL